MPEGNGSRRSADLDALCRRYGLTTEYTDIWGKPQRATERTRVALLKALGALDESSDAKTALETHEAAAWLQVHPPVAVFRVEQAPYRLNFYFSERHLDAAFRWTFEVESAQTRVGEFRPRDLEIVGRREIGGEQRVHVA